MMTVGSKKRERRSQVHIHDLHEEIFCRITEQLELKEAVRTSVLSKKWRSVWTYHPKLTFDCAGVLGSGINAHKNRDLFVRRVHSIMLRRQAAVTELRVKFLLTNEHAGHLDRWLDIAVAKRARHLALDLRWPGKNFCRHPYMYAFPCHLLGAQHGGGRHLQSLHLFSVSMEQIALAPAGSPPCLPSLKRLELAFSDVDEATVHCLLSACGDTLEWLRFEDCQLLCGLTVTGGIQPPLPRLRHFAADDCIAIGRVELRAPRLVSFRFAGLMKTRILLDEPQLAALEELDVMYTWCYDVFDYVQTDLPSRAPCLRSLSVYAHGFFKAMPFPNKFMHLRNLRLSLDAGDQMERESQRERKDIFQLALFLEAAPFLELFVLHMRSGKRSQYDDMAEMRSLPSCPHEHLRRVYMSGFAGLRDQIELARHILCNAVRLERMTVNPKYDDGEPRRCHRFNCEAIKQGRQFASSCLPCSDRRKVLEIL